MNYYEQEIRQFWDALFRYLEARRLLFGPDGQPTSAPEEHRRRLQSVVDEYDDELDRLMREAARDARRISQEYSADTSRYQAWVQQWAALTFANIVGDARDRLRRRPVDGERPLGY